MGKIRQTLASFFDRAKERLFSFFQPDFLRWFGRFLLFGVAYTLVFMLFFGTLRFTLPYLLAFLIAWMMQPAIRGLTKRLRWKRGTASSFMLILVILLMATVVALITWRLIAETIAVVQRLAEVNFIEVFNNVEDFLTGWTLPITGEQPVLDFLGQYEEQIDAALTALSEYLKRMVSGLGRSMLNGISSVPTGLMAFIVMLFAIYYSALDWDKGIGLNRIFSKRTLDQSQRFYRESLRMAGNYCGAYIKLIMITLALTIVLFLILDVPYALLFAILAAFFDIIPMIGVSLVYIPLMIYFAFMQNWFVVIGLLIGLVVVTVVRRILEPKFVSKSINVHPLLMVGIFLLGFQLGNLWIVLYLTLFAIIYQVADTIGMFEKEIPVQAKKKEAEGQ